MNRLTFQREDNTGPTLGDGPVAPEYSVFCDDDEFNRSGLAWDDLVSVIIEATERFELVEVYREGGSQISAPHIICDSSRPSDARDEVNISTRVVGAVGDGDDLLEIARYVSAKTNT